MQTARRKPAHSNSAIGGPKPALEKRTGIQFAKKETIIMTEGKIPEGKVCVNYYHAPSIALELLDGLEETVFYDTYKIRGKFTHVLNYKGVDILAGIMGCYVEFIKEVEDETDEKVYTLESEAYNPQGHKGFAKIARTKLAGKDLDPTYRQKAYTAVRRSALKSLVPHQVLCEMLVKRKQRTPQGRPTAQPQPTAETQQGTTGKRGTQASADAKKKTQETLVSEQLKEVRDKARQAGIDGLNGKLFKELGIDVQDCINEVAAQTGISDTDKWSVAHWEQLIQIIERPVAMGMAKAVEAWNKLHPDQEASKTEELESPEQNSKDVLDSEEDVEEDIFSESEDSESEDADDEAVEAEDASDDEQSEEEQLEMFIEELNGESKSE